VANATLRAAAAEVFARHQDVLKSVTICEARVASDRLTRGVLTAFDWLTGSPWPRATFGKVRDAEEWIGARLRYEATVTRSPDDRQTQSPEEVGRRRKTGERQ